MRDAKLGMAGSKGSFDSTAVAKDYFELQQMAAGNTHPDRPADNGSSSRRGAP
jgi:hypothetical protein